MSLVFSSMVNSAPTPTPEQIRMFKQLSPQQQQQAIKQFQSGGNVSQPAIANNPRIQPTLVIPNSVQAAENSDAIVKAAESAIDAPELNTQPQNKITPRKLKQFGYDLFSGTPTTFAPATDIPIPTSFIVGPGDTVQVQLFGRENAEYDLVVSREGKLRFPGIGPISVVGLRFDELKNSLSERIQRQMIGVKANVTMGTLRSIRVFVLGDVIRPGSYTVSALSTMTNALFVSGGITPVGSLRNIQLKRSGKIVSSIDLYDLLLAGDTSNDARLQPGDVIFVPPIGNTVGVAGEVKRPAIYELNRKYNVNEVLALAGGMLASAYPEATQVERFTNSGDKTLIDIDITNPATSPAVQNGDVIRVYSALEKMQNIVLLSGHVQRPGGAQWFNGMRLTHLISSVDELRPKPDLKYVLIKREVLPERSIVVITTRIDKALAQQDSTFNTLLKARDEVIFFGLGDKRIALINPIIAQLKQQERFNTPSKTVSVRGNVYFPGEYPYSEKMRLTDIIRAAYDIKPSTDMDYAVIARRINHQGKIQAFSVSISQALSDSQNDSNVLLQEKDEVYIFSNSEYLEEPENLLNRQTLLKPLINKIQKQTKFGEMTPIVSISGSVLSPGQYLFEHDMQISDLIRAAGGLTEAAYTHSAELSRYKVVNGEFRESDHFAISQSQLFSKEKQTQSSVLQPYDHLNIKRIPLWVEQQSIEIKGEVKFPGTYQFRRGETLSAVLNRAGGLNAYAFAEGALFLREDLSRREQQEIDKLSARLESDLAAMKLEQSQSSGKQSDIQATGLANSLLKQLNETKAAGRLVIDLGQIMQIAEAEHEFDEDFEENGRDITLRDGDKLFIPQRTQEVTILGEVQQSTSHLYDDTLSRDDYIQLSGGVTYKADSNRIYIVKANGAVVSDDSSWFGYNIGPGDTIVVPLDADRMKPLTFWTNITQIVYQLGISAAAWKTVGVF